MWECSQQSGGFGAVGSTLDSRGYPPSGATLRGGNRKPDVVCSSRAYGRSMTARETNPGIDKHASVTVDAAAQLAGVDEASIRRWSETGSLKIRRLGDMEVVRLDEVQSLKPVRAEPRAGRAALRKRLRGASTETLSVIDLQERARERRSTR